MTEEKGKNILTSIPFIPDMVVWHAYKWGTCELCKIEKSKDKDFDNKSCPHCKKLTKVISGCCT